MAKIIVAGEAVVVTSDVTLEDLKKVEKYRPEELVLYRDQEKKEPMFKVGTTRCTFGRINPMGAEFGGEAKDGSGKATITLVADCGGNDDKDVRERVAEQVGVGILYLNKIEEKIPGILAEINGEHDKIVSNITVI